MPAVVTRVKNPDGKEFTIRTAVHHDGDPAVIDEYASGAEKIVNEAAAIFGEFPAFDTGTYTFLGDYVPWGGGDGADHSSVFARHGFALAIGPRTMLRMKLKKNTGCTASRESSPMVAVVLKC